MGRIRQYIEIGEKKYWTLFDSGARNTYVIKEVALNLPTFKLLGTNPVALGGKVHTINENCLLSCKIKGYNISDHAFVLDSIGIDEEKKPIEVLIGSLLMQRWGIALIPEKEDIDLSNYPKEFVEF